MIALALGTLMTLLRDVSCVAGLALAGLSPASSAPISSTPAIAAELGRLDGQSVTVAADGASYHIDDIAGEGPPRVGTIERREGTLWLIRGSQPALALTGPLAIPRIAGPGYRVWIIGDSAEGMLRIRRIGILRPPRRR